MKTICALFVLILLVGCVSSTAERATKETTDIVYNDPPDLSGRWRYIRNEVIIDAPEWDIAPEIMTEWTYMYIPYRADIIIEGDSLYRVDYPIELDYRMKYDIGSCYLKTGGNIGISRYVLNYDTLIFYRYDENNLVKELFKKIDYCDSTMSILKEDTINYSLLAGTWFLQRSYNYGNDGSEYWLDYPHTIPDSFNLSRKHILKTMHTGRQVTFLTDGINRSYTYDYVGNWLNLIPGDWYKGEDVVLEFERYDEYDY